MRALRPKINRPKAARAHVLDIANGKVEWPVARKREPRLVERHIVVQRLRKQGQQFRPPNVVSCDGGVGVRVSLLVWVSRCG